MGNRSSSTRAQIRLRRMRKVDYKAGNTPLPKASPRDLLTKGQSRNRSKYCPVTEAAKHAKAA